MINDLHTLSFTESENFLSILVLAVITVYTHWFLNKFQLYNYSQKTIHARNMQFSIRVFLFQSSSILFESAHWFWIYVLWEFEFYSSFLICICSCSIFFYIHLTSKLQINICFSFSLAKKWIQILDLSTKQLFLSHVWLLCRHNKLYLRDETEKQNIQKKNTYTHI